ncbi:cardiolipin synthase [Alkalihalobacillus sp. MEB130]|uniref:cardiolipin synthase n=1 Tax=Alkalihalobacillus sp. MEB130 TaxID=2976704 RepID=UPI0028E06D74|nr:cardiolipin synthase [Alkalihalobacillus sp. MEB130]MDT8860476.1 cardiolipin synthase [Alkalihalobacillus sp. MEB130]
MNGWVITALLILAVLIWLRIDFMLGLRQQRKEGSRHVQKTRYADVTLLPTGDDFYRRLFADIEQATDHVHVLFYIFRNDHISQKLLKILAGKAKEGVTVRLLVDKLGSHITRNQLKTLREAGVNFAFSHPISLPYLFFTFNRRNHRKLTIVDGRVGFIGGYNVGDEYLGRDPKFGPWRDFHLRLDGDGVQDLQGQFLQDWQTAKQKYVKKESHYPPLEKGPIPLRILPTDGIYLEETFIDLISQAKETIVIGTPYYIPGQALQKELIAAAKRGVDVKLIVPKKGDHPLVKEAAFPYFEPLLEAGINVYQYYRGFFHAKAVVIDNQVCDIGTANFDQRSFHINHEINCLIYDAEFIQTVLKEMEHDISISERLTLEAYHKRPFSQKGKEKVAKLVSGLL